MFLIQVMPAHTPPYLLGDNGVFQIMSGCTYSGNTFTCGGGGGGGSGFDQITSGSNTSATMTVSTGATMGVTGTGIITASGFNELAVSTSSTTALADWSFLLEHEPLQRADWQTRLIAL